MGPERGEETTTTSGTPTAVDAADITKDGNNIKVYYTIVDNSLLSKMEELQSIISEFSYDIIAVNEVKPKNGLTPSKDTLNLDGYDLFTSDFDEIDVHEGSVCMSKSICLLPN